MSEFQDWTQEEPQATDFAENVEHTPEHSDTSNTFFVEEHTPTEHSFTEEPVSVFNTEPVQVQTNNYSLPVMENEEDPLQVYQRERNIRLDEKARKADQLHQQTLETARQETDQFYQRRLEAKQKQHSNNTFLEKKFVEERDNALAKNSGSTGGNPWDQVSFYIDFKRAVVGKDSSRLRKVLIDLKH